MRAVSFDHTVTHGSSQLRTSHTVYRVKGEYSWRHLRLEHGCDLALVADRLVAHLELRVRARELRSEHDRL